MRVVVAPDKFKEAATAGQVAAAIRDGVLDAVPDAEVDLCPVADGGEGTVAAIGGRRRTSRVTGPLGEPVDAEWSLLDDGTAVVEMAAAAGLALVPPERRDPRRTTTFGVGELIRAALDAGARRVVVGAGGSATVDGGIGAAQALGVRFPRKAGAPTSSRGAGVPPALRIGPTASRDDDRKILEGGDLLGIQAVALDGCDPRLVDLVVACDVTTPLLEAAAVYGPQKGADPGAVEELGRGLAHLASLCPGADRTAEGSGAAGGLAFGLAALCGARLVRGADLVLARIGFADRVRGADLVITGEGRLDVQTARGKAVAEVARHASAAGVPAVALVGAIGEGADRVAGLDAWFTIGDRPMSRQEALERTLPLLRVAAAKVVRRYGTR